jgi:hypothetical protein
MRRGHSLCDHCAIILNVASLCKRIAFAAQSPRDHSVIALQSLRNRLRTALQQVRSQLLWNRSAVALHFLCNRFAIDVLSQCDRSSALTFKWPCNRFADALQSLAIAEQSLSNQYAIVAQSLRNQ